MPVPVSVSSNIILKPLVGAVCAALCLGLALPVVVASAASGAAVAATPTDNARVRYTILLKDEPVASYRGGVAGFAAAGRFANGSKAGRLDVKAPASVAYAAHLAQVQSAFLGALSASVGRSISAVATMQHALNAVIVEIDEREAAIAAQRPDVELVEREQIRALLTDRGPAFIGAPLIWDGTASNGVMTQGEGIVIADLDTGINWESPAFAAVGPIDGYVHVNPNGSGTYLGLCGPTPPNADLGRCNDKLIGMYDFTTTSATRSAVDLGGHGSHTASTVAGNHWSAPFGGSNFTISGVAPHANVIAYRVCTTGCGQGASSQAVNQAVIDQADVLNFSISGGVSPWGDSVSIAFRNAVNAGMFVAASAGNDGPDAGTINHVEPWVETVGASTKDSVIGFAFNLTGPGTPPPETQNLPLRPAAPPLPSASIVSAPIVRSPNFADGANDGCAAYPAETFTAVAQPDSDVVFADGFEGEVEPARVGAIAVLALDPNTSACGSIARRTAALTAGAIGVIFVDRDFINLGASDTSWSMLRADWDQAWAQIQTNPSTATASLLLPTASFPQRGDVVADFSSRGPLASLNQVIVKPDITAPGVDIIAAYAGAFGGATATAMENGTSMSGPHTTGSGALLRALQPTWTPTEIRSAINLTSKRTGLIRADGSDVDAWDLGSGRVDLTRAALTGLVMDETNANFVAANPSASGDMSTLNLASMASQNCATTCSFTRTVRSTSLVSRDYALTFTGPTAAAATVVPATFTIAAGATQVITVTINGTALATGWNFNHLELAGNDVLLPLLHMPIAIKH
ncbi:MAG: S8 family serine peptidase [Dokdonella sp.]|uniref:S8 family serine peptidase n=1 Tax=Dokdonella sp. TaxID=2291710 RepID=UPI003263D2EE